MTPPTVEKRFQNDIINAMQHHGWVVGASDQYNKELALYPADILAFIKNSQPEQYDHFAKHYPPTKTNPNATQEALLKSVRREIIKKGTLDILLKGIKDRGAKFALCFFQPDHDLNPDAATRYQQNIFRVVPELVYSPNNYDGRLDLTLFINGIPVVTCELKSEFNQSIELAKKQYKEDRPPKNEPLLTFKSGALVHFAISQLEVAMTTKLDGKNTYFLPFNQGTKDGGAGNDAPHNPNEYATAYLWNEIFAKDHLLTIIQRYIHIQSSHDGTKESMIFPRYHQWAVVSKLLHTVDVEGSGEKYLIQHSAGSGKSNSIAWLAHQLSSKHYHHNHAALHKQIGDKVFDSVIVITDRTVLDNQLQDTIHQFEHQSGQIARINREEAQGSKSAQLTQELKKLTPIIIVTIQTFPFVLQAIREEASLAGRSFAIIADEAHSSQTGTTARQLREVLMSKQLNDEQEMDSEDILQMTIEARKGSRNISYFAFTATPKAKTVELFGRKPEPDQPASTENKPQPFHVYSMRQAIEEGFILDVLKNYTSYKTAYQLAQRHPDQDYEVDSKKASAKIKKWVRLHPHNISQKVEIIIEHFNAEVKAMLGGEAKAMVVTSGRLDAVRYKLAFEKYTKEQGYHDINAMVAFSGEVIDPDFPDHAFTEKNMNPKLNGRDMRKAFDSQDYQVMIVANKFQTGFDQPKLVAMYVDKKLKGVECIQTLSRLNRVCNEKGKDTTFVLDFINDPEDVLDEFKVYYQTAELMDVSDPNIIYALMESIIDAGIFYWDEVERFVEAFYNKKTNQAQLINICKPAIDRFKQKYDEAAHSIEEVQSDLRHITNDSDQINTQRYELQLSKVKEYKDRLDIFKKNLLSFGRYYEFISQIVDFNDIELEKLAIYTKYLYPLLRLDSVEDGIDLNNVMMTHYRISKQKQKEIDLTKGNNVALDPAKVGEGATPKDRHTEFLYEIIQKMNDLFAGEDFSEKDFLNYANTILGKVSENEKAMAQVKNNTKEQAMLGQFPAEIEKAIIESSNIHQAIAYKALANKEIAEGIASIVFDMLIQQQRAIQIPK